jgi:hypothetical protein
MGNNLTGQQINLTYQQLVQISGSIPTDGTGSVITNLNVSASYASTSGFAGTAGFATSASHAINANTSISASFAQTASYALNAVTNSGSFMITGSVNSNTLTFTKGDGSTFNLTVNTGSIPTVNTGSLLTTASISNATTTYTKADGSTFALVTNNVNNAISASVAATASLALTAISASQATNANTATSASFASTAGIANNIVNGLSPTFNNITVTNTASFGYIQAVTGSAVYIGESFVVVNADSPAVRYAGIAVFDSGSSPIASASLEWDSLNDTWIAMEETGNTAVMITGPTGSRGSETYTTVNKLQKGLGFNYIGDSSITDNGTNVTFTTPIAGTAISASTGFLGNLTGTASFATSASFAATASYALNATTSENYWSDGVGLTNFTGSDNLFADTGSWNYTIGNTYAFASSISASFFASVNASIGRTLRSAIIAGNNNKMRDNTGAFDPTFIVQDSVIIGGVDNAILGKQENTFIVGGNTNTIEASTCTNSGIFGGANNVMYSSDNAIIIGGSSNLNRSNSDTNVILGGANNTFDFVSNTILIGGYSIAQQSTSNDLVFIGSRNFSTNAQNYNVYLGVNGTGRTFGAGTIDRYKTYIDDLTVSGSLSASFFSGDGSGLTNIAAATASYLSNWDINQNAVFSGSVRGEVGALSISSNTASLDCSTGNFFTLTLVSGSTTHINPTNILPGQTINLRVTQANPGNGTVSFPGSVKQVSGSAYVPSVGSGPVDVVTFISFDSTSLFLSNVKNLV